MMKSLGGLFGSRRGCCLWITAWRGKKETGRKPRQGSSSLPARPSSSQLAGVNTTQTTHEDGDDGDATSGGITAATPHSLCGRLPPQAKQKSISLEAKTQLRQNAGPLGNNGRSCNCFCVWRKRTRVKHGYEEAMKPQSSSSLTRLKTLLDPQAFLWRWHLFHF